MASPVLTEELLAELAERWRERKIPAEEHLQSGLSDAALDSYEVDLGFSLPAELRTWFRWHNGMSESDPLPGAISPDLRTWSLDRVIGRTFEYRAILADVQADLEPEHRYPFAIWPRTRLQLYRAAGPVMVECAGEASEGRCPVFWFDSHDVIRAENVTEPVAASLGELVSWWIEAWDSGVYAWDAGKCRQTYDYKRVPRERDRLV